MNHPSDHPMPDDSSIHKRAVAAVHSHRIKLRVLTTSAFAFGFLAVAISTFIIWMYCYAYLPKQKEILQKTEQVLREKPNASDVDLSLRRINRFVADEVLFTHVISIAVTVVALSVGLLGLGTLVLLTVVVLNRRIALNQINFNLAQISDQLRELQAPRGGT